MKAILELLRSNGSLVEKLKTSASVEEAAKLLVEACKQHGQSVKLGDVTKWLAERPQSDPHELSDDELQAVSGGAIKTTWETKLSACSQVCCNTCRTSEIIW